MSLICRLLIVIEIVTVTGFNLENNPLVFGYIRTDPEKLMIYFDPLVSIKQVTEIANRDVRYVKSNQTKEMTEDFSEWRILVGSKDNDDGTKRYIFLKQALCDEVEWRVTWIDSFDVVHGPIIQRMQPSPIPWHSETRLDISSIVYDKDSDSIIALPTWTTIRPEEANLGSAEIMSDFEPSFDLIQCQHTFKKPQQRPEVINDGQIKLKFPAEYGKARCQFWIRLMTHTYDEKLQCRERHETVEGASYKLTLDCIEGMDCSVKNEQPCDMGRCEPLISSSGVYTYDQSQIARPMIKVSWTPTIADRPVFGFVMRHVQIDRSHFNHPIKEFNVTVERFNSTTFGTLFKPYSNNEGASYGVQLCTLYESRCLTITPRWETVPQTALFFNRLIKDMPPPETTTTSSATTTTTHSTTAAISSSSATVTSRQSPSHRTTDVPLRTRPLTIDKRITTPAMGQRVTTGVATPITKSCTSLRAISALILVTVILILITEAGILQ